MSTSTATYNGIDRRTALKLAAGAATGGAIAGVAQPASAQSDGGDLETRFEDVENYDGVVDKTGIETVEIEVGAAGNGGNFAFGPAAVQIDPGTTVVWTWTGEGGSHNVVAENGSYESDLYDAAGETYEQTFDDDGVSRYVCAPHESMGMKGAVIVGNVPTGGVTKPSADPDYGDWFDDVENYVGTVDVTGQKEVRITVGAEGNGGNFAFDPPAVRIDPGTTVVWVWSGEGGMHNVADEAVGYESEMLSEAGATYALRFDGEGMSKYVCTPHEAMGMKGAVVVGGQAANDISITPEVAAVGGGFLMALLSPLAFGVFLLLKGTDESPDARPTAGVESKTAENSPDRSEQEAVHTVDSNSMN